MVSGMHPFTDVSAAKLRQKDFSCSRCQCFFLAAYHFLRILLCLISLFGK